jgi:hypothetical protein
VLGADPLHAFADTPNLSGAACVDHHELFDACTERGANLSYALAIKICQGCPALTPCRAWIEGLRPSQRPLGICGGLIHCT